VRDAGKCKKSPPKGEVTPILKLMTRDKGDKRKLVEKLELKTEETELV